MRTTGARVLGSRLWASAAFLIVFRTDFRVAAIADEFVDGVWWTERAENLVPGGFRADSDANWRRTCRDGTIVGLVSDGTCGNNAEITFRSGTRACCRQRNNFDQLQGDVFSFVLARRLGIANVPSTSLVRPRADAQWSAVKSQLAVSEWRQDRPVVVTKFVPGLEPAMIPMQLRERARRLHPHDARNRTDSELVDLVQWSDLILFDYLTGNVDRVVNNLYNRQWNEEMMNAPAHNLGKVRGSGLLVFLDNESGLVHGYRLIRKYEMYHRDLLGALCVFRRRTVELVRRLVRRGDAGGVIQSDLERLEGERAAWLPPFPVKSRTVLQERLGFVDRHVRRCELMYPVR